MEGSVMSTKKRSGRGSLMEIASHSGHVCEFEFVPNERNAREIYVVFDGKRIAYRGKPGTPQARTWVSTEPGFEVFNNADRTQLTVQFNGVTVN
jgi:hypothetical protein